MSELFEFLLSFNPNSQSSTKERKKGKNRTANFKGSMWRRKLNFQDHNEFSKIFQYSYIRMNQKIFLKKRTLFHLLRDVKLS